LVRCLLALIKGYSSPVSLPKSLTTVTDDRAMLPRRALARWRVSIAELNRERCTRAAR
jgi:hypothetical protein